MRTDEVPQDPSFYRGHKRVCFAVDGANHYVVAKSGGWEVERVATEQALLALEAEVEDARQRVLRGERAPLAYHLATRMMTPRLFARHAGVAAWRVRRHLKPRVFARLAPALRARYARCLDLDVAALGRVPDRPTRVFLTEGAPDAGHA